jgi:hypothetical protein
LYISVIDVHESGAGETVVLCDTAEFIVRELGWSCVQVEPVGLMSVWVAEVVRDSLVVRHVVVVAILIRYYPGHRDFVEVDRGFQGIAGDG